jgi:hypothetical protein
MEEEKTSKSSFTPAFIRLAAPPAFDIHRHISFAKTQLPADQLENLERALKEDPELFSDASKNDLILDCEAEESFTLETFGNLLKAARASNKDFVLARVTTLDPTGPKPQLYHSHYSAHHINKILFRTQPREGLLHRMRSRNPLNNMIIVGEVDYFAIRPVDYDAARKRYESLVKQKKQGHNDNSASELENPNPIPSITATPTSESVSDLTDSLLFGLLQRKKAQVADTQTSSPEINVAPFENAADYTSPNQSSMDLEAPLRASLNGSSSSLARSDSLNKLPEGDEPAILYDAQPFATDEDYLMRSDVREYFKANSVTPEDYLLFTVYRSAEGVTEIPVTGFTSIPMAENEGSATATTRKRTWKNCWGLFYPPSPSLSTLRTGFISREAFKYIIMLYIIGCILALIFFIPLELSYFVGFGMFVLIVVVTVFFVECNPDPESTRWSIFSYRQRMQQQREIATANANITSSQFVSDNNSSSALNV